ncbi:MAG: LysM peptidoglycan-binding domain-containing protein [Deltaproteobacteria bacterium]|nr:LysM peptidoglycan-binding domain-containing protein [Candidatus Anaeroferrophillacea bacterium]
MAASWRQPEKWRPQRVEWLGILLVAALLLLPACAGQRPAGKAAVPGPALAGAAAREPGFGAGGGAAMFSAGDLPSPDGDDASLGGAADRALAPWDELPEAFDLMPGGSLAWVHEYRSELLAVTAVPSADDLQIEAEARTGARYRFPIVINDKVERFISYYSTVNQDFTRRSLKRSQLYLPTMRRILRENHIPEELVYMVLIESGFTTHALSRARACGPWQFIGGTGRTYGLKIDWWVDERRDPVKATHAAAAYLNDLYGYFGSWYLAAAAYNAGEGKIMRAIKRHRTEDFWEMARYSYLKRETREYIPRLIAAILIGREPEKYGITDIDYLPPLAWDEVEVKDATDLRVVAWAAGAAYDVVRELNPELKFWCTPPGAGGYRVKVPEGRGEECRQRLAMLPPEQRITFRRHLVRPGETLSGIARRYRTHVQPIRELNRLRGSLIRAGSHLIVPVRAAGSGPVEFAPEIYAGDPPRADAGGENRLHRPSAYRVRRGDNLWRIARRFGVRVAQIREWNGLDGGTLIHPGQVVLLSGSGRSGAAATAEPKTVTKRPRVVHLRKGDTLWKLARTYGISVQQLCRWNDLRADAVIHPGQRLELYPSGE